MLIIEEVKLVIDPESRFTIFIISAATSPTEIYPMNVSNWLLIWVDVSLISSISAPVSLVGFFFDVDFTLFRSETWLILILLNFILWYTPRIKNVVCNVTEIIIKNDHSEKSK